MPLPQPCHRASNRRLLPLMLSVVLLAAGLAPVRLPAASARSAAPQGVAEVSASAIVAGSSHTCAALTSGGAQCWGRNHSGQLGDGTRTRRRTPVMVQGLPGAVTALAAGYHHTCALLASGGVRCWGDNYYGELGDGTRTDRLTPVRVQGLGGAVTALVAGSSHTCAALVSGGVRCWGYNEYGQLGDGTPTNSSAPVRVQGLAGAVTALAAGSLHTCALLTSGGVKCWGGNSYGQLGTGTLTRSRIPVRVQGLGGAVAALAAGSYHTCAALTSGGVRCWGWNTSGQLGDGNHNYRRLTPVSVQDLGGVVTALAAGHAHTCALLAGGGAQCWGLNTPGQLGDGSTTRRLTPVDVVGLGGAVAALAAGQLHTCAVLTSGGAQCWGSNEYGQLGDDTTTDRPTPVVVVGFSP